MKASVVLLCLASLCTLALPNPVPDRVVLPRQTTMSALATITPGATGVPASEANPASCVDIDLAGQTRNDIVDGLPCKPFTLIFARGTFELGGIGGLVGPPLVDALVSLLGSDNVAVQGVDNYPADIIGFLAGGSATGSADMAQLITQTRSQCPDTVLCVSGYSQVAQVAHNAANLISESATAFINSVVLFGDPDNGEPFGGVPASKVSTVCHAGDDICLHGDLIFLQHLTYCLNVDQEASFAVAQSGLT